MEKIKKSKEKVKTPITQKEQKLLKIQKKNEKKTIIFQKKASKTAPIQIKTKKVITTTPNIDKNNKQIKKDLFKCKNSNKNSKTNWKLSFREFPVKMAKEFTRIIWISKDNLKCKFLITILFIIAFAVFYLVLDLILHYLLTITHII